MTNRCPSPLSFAAEKPFLNKNSGILSHKMKEDKELSNFKFTTDYGLHYGASVVASISKFFGSSFPPQAL